MEDVLYFCSEYDIIKKEEIADGIFSFTISCADVASAAGAGQFVHVRAKGFTLRRPISICEVDKENGTIRIVFEVRGEGTKELSMLNAGDKMDMIAPLGRGFNPVELNDGEKAIVVGGGIGVPPLVQTAKAYGENAIAVIGFRTASKIILEDDFKAFGAEVLTCTDDGSFGHCGTVIEPLTRAIETNKIARIHACGPIPMLRGIVKIAEELDIPCEISLEERMGCGVGACLVCNCKVNRRGKDYYVRVCKDGPVFNSKEVVF